VHDDLHQLARVLDLDEPIVIRVRHEPDPESARLLVTLGAGWIVDPCAPPCATWCGHSECRVPVTPHVSSSRAFGLGEMSLGVSRHVHEPNWVDYRSSVANVDRRADRGDVAPTCEECGCELDVAPVPHSPKCPVRLAATAGATREQIIERLHAWAADHNVEAPRASEVGETARAAVVEFGSWSNALKEAGFSKGTPQTRGRLLTGETNGEVDGRELLERMDAGERVGLEEAPVSSTAGASGASSSTDDESGPAQPAPTPEGERHSRSSAGGGARTTRSSTPAQDAVLELLAGGPMRLKEIADARGVDAASAFVNVASLIKRGLVEKVSRGVYALADSGRGPQAAPLAEAEVAGVASPGAVSDEPTSRPSRPDTTAWEMEALQRVITSAAIAAARAFAETLEQGLM
jgi:Homing endonuclease associated repeat/Transcriptional regulator, AbiEi antitoxin